MHKVSPQCYKINKQNDYIFALPLYHHQLRIPKLYLLFIHIVKEIFAATQMQRKDPERTIGFKHPVTNFRCHWISLSHVNLFILRLTGCTKTLVFRRPVTSFEHPIHGVPTQIPPFRLKTHPRPTN